MVCPLGSWRVHFLRFQLQQQQQFQQIPQLSGVAPWVETKVGIISSGRNLPVIAISLKCNYLWWTWPAAELGFLLETSIYFGLDQPAHFEDDDFPFPKVGYVSFLQGNSWSLNFLSQPFFRIPKFLTNLPAMMTHSDWWITSVNPGFWWFEIPFRCHGGTSSDYWSGGVVGWWWLSTTGFLLSLPWKFSWPNISFKWSWKDDARKPRIPYYQSAKFARLGFPGSQDVEINTTLDLWITCF